VRFTWQAATKAVALLSTVGNVVLAKNVQGIWRAGLNWPAGRSLAIPGIWQGGSPRSTALVARWLSHKTAKWCHKKLLNSAENLVTSFQLKSAKSCEILRKNLLFLWWLKSTYKVTNQLFVLHLHYYWTSAENIRLGHHTFRPTISFPSTFWAIQKCSFPRFCTVWHTAFKNLFQMVVCVCTIDQCSAINRLSIASASTTF